MATKLHLFKFKCDCSRYSNLGNGTVLSNGGVLCNHLCVISRCAGRPDDSRLWPIDIAGSNHAARHPSLKVPRETRVDRRNGQGSAGHAPPAPPTHTLTVPPILCICGERRYGAEELTKSIVGSGQGATVRHKVGSVWGRAGGLAIGREGADSGTRGGS